MLSDKIIQNKIYLYKNEYYKVKKILRQKQYVVIQSMKDGEEIEMPLVGSEILLSRAYTIGEVAKIVERRPDTIRKYERDGLIPKPHPVGEEYPSYSNWRIYKSSDIYEIVEFFSNRTPGRPVKQAAGNKLVENKVKQLNQKVKLVSRGNASARS